MPRKPKQQRDAKLPAEICTRMGEILAEDVDVETGRVSVSFSSEAIVRGVDGAPEILLHEPSALDLKRLREVGSVLFNHDKNVIVGRPENVRLDETTRKVRAEIVFDSDPKSQEIAAKVKSGSLRGTSVRARVGKWEYLQDQDTLKTPQGRSIAGPAYVATQWQPIEFSLTPVPADEDVGVGRCETAEPVRKDDLMNETVKAALIKRGLKADATDDEAQAFLERAIAEPADPKPTGGEPLTDPQAERIRCEGERRERSRVIEIREVCGLHESTRALADDLIVKGVGADQARKSCLEHLVRTQPPVQNQVRVELGEDERDKFRSIAEDWLGVRIGRIKEKEKVARIGELGCHRIFDLAKESLRRGHVSTLGSPDELIQRAIGNSSSDFPYLLANVAKKSLMAGWAEAPATYAPLVRQVTVSDFKAIYFPRLGDSGDLILNPPGLPMAEGSFAEKTGSVQVATYARRFGITRQAIINDDLSALSEIPSLMGAAARRVPNALFWDLLVSASGVGPTMDEDSYALFSASHTSGTNYTASALSLDITGLATPRKCMRLQKGLVNTGETAPTLNVTPEFLIVPAALESAALQVTSTITPALIGSVNLDWMRGLKVIVEPRLDSATNGTTAWYVAANPTSYSGFVMAFLEGRSEPTMVREDGTNILGVEWGVYLDCGVKCLDHRSWYRVRGA
jgi:phage head maturation protease